jgi:protein tyrosine/serine phosphatase
MPGALSRRTFLWVAGVAGVGLVLVGPSLFARWQTSSQRNFRVVEPGVLYRSGQMDVGGLRRAVHDYGLRTIVTLREAGDSSVRVQQEEDYCQKDGINYVSLPVRAWSVREGEAEAPAMENVRQLLSILRDKRNHPVLIHCFAGIHRTGIYVAVCRMERDGWDLDHALQEMRACGYTEYDQHDDVKSFLGTYVPGRK